jgi:cytochrome b561
MVIAKFQIRVRSVGLQEADIRPFSRQLVRAVFLLLYVLFAASQLITLGVSWWNRGTLGALHPAVQLPPENLRDYLAYGVCALLAIHGLAALQRRRLRRSRASACPHRQDHE